MSNDDRRLIEDYLPIEAISKEASREKSVRKGHISTLHLWWARRPLVACRAAVYGALVPASRFRPQNGPEQKRESLTRANAAKFVERLCKYPGDPQVIAEAQRHILEAHAERLTEETGKKVTVKDIEEGRAPRPKVLDMFAGGGSIPLEALRLGCEAYALDLNPVAHIIELCTLVFPQKYGRPDRNARGSAKDGTWAGLAEEVRHWGKCLLEKVKAEIGDLYPPIPNPKATKTRRVLGKAQLEMGGTGFEHAGQQDFAVETPSGYLTPLAYLWTRTARCRNPSCGATVPLVKQTWLCKKRGRFVALRMIAATGKREVRFEVVEATSEKELGFDPARLSTGGNATCLFCGTVADSEYVHQQGRDGRIEYQLMAVSAADSDRGSRRYLPGDIGQSQESSRVAEVLAQRSREGLQPPNERIPPTGNAGAATGISFLYGMETFGAIFTRRQMAALLTCVAVVKQLDSRLEELYPSRELRSCLTAYLALAVSRVVNQNNTLCVYHAGRETVEGSLGRKRLIYSWDFPETNPLTKTSGSLENSIDWIVAVIETLSVIDHFGTVRRGSAMRSHFENAFFDAVVTDPPYYDNIGYSELSDLFYVWIRRMLSHIFPGDFSGELTPKKEEAVAAAYRQGGTQELARSAYQTMMLEAFKEAGRVLKPGCPMITIYAHKTTSGWSTLVDALRQAKFEIIEAWPLDTELQTGMTKQDMAMLSSSISLVARKRDGIQSGSYEQVKPELEQIVRERVATLWDMGISGADLVISCVGAGLRAFTRYAKVEYANGEEVPAERFLMEVETVVLESVLARLSKEVGSNGGRYGLASVDPWTRFYTLWRYTYKSAELDAGEAIIFANGTHVELDGANGLSSGPRPLVEKKKSKYRLLDYTDRGDDTKLGLPLENGQPAPLVDALHRLVWLMERHPSGVLEFLRDARPNTEQLRLVAQALAGPALKGGELGEVATGSELAALTKLTANWRSVVGDATAGPLFDGHGA